MMRAVSVRRTAVLAVVVVLALVVAFVVWRPSGTESGDPVPSSTTTTEVEGPVATEDPAPAPEAPAGAPIAPPATDTGPAPSSEGGAPVEPEVVAAIEDEGSTPVVVALDVPEGLAPEERAVAVAAAAEAVLASLPEGSYEGVKPTGTVPMLSLAVDASGLAALRDADPVAAVGVDGLNEPFSVASIEAAEVDEAWERGATGTGGLVAVLDTGVQASHPYLSSDGVSDVVAEACFSTTVLSSAASLTSLCPGGASSAVGDGSAAPCALGGCWHGTHVAGIAAGGAGLDSLGSSTSASGVAPDAGIIAVQVFSSYTTSLGSAPVALDSDITDALQWLYAERAQYPGLAAVNLSLGDPNTEYSGTCEGLRSSLALMKVAIDDLRSAGIITVIASGNKGWRGAIAAPACISSAVAIGAVDNSVPPKVAGFSNHGTEVELLAPGVAIRSSIPPSTMGSSNGTSMATPAAAGALAVLAEARPDLSAEERLTALKTSGEPLTAAGVSRPTIRLGLPDQPREVEAFGGDSSVAVSWMPSERDERLPLTVYRVTTASGGAGCTTTGTTSCVVEGLTNGVAYTVEVVAENAHGTGPAAAAAAPVVPAPSAMEPLVPARLMDTRPAGPDADTVDDEFLGEGPVEAGLAGVRSFEVLDRGGVPESGVGAVALNVTVTGPTAWSDLRVFPAGADVPNASNLNFVAGETVPNMVIAKLGVGGEVSVFNAAGSAHVVVDVLGWFPESSSYVPLEPVRLMDTRPAGPDADTFDDLFLGEGPVGSQPRSLEVTGRGLVPPTGVGAVALNVTVTGPTAWSNLRVYPGDSDPPNASNLNFTVGQTVPNMVIAKVGADGTVDIANAAGATHVVVDIMGWFPAATGYAPLDPARLMDTRTGSDAATIDGQFVGTSAVSSGPGQIRTLTVTGRGGVPSSGVSAVALNVTAVGPTAFSNLRVFPTGAPVPNASNLNFVAGETVPNMVIAQVGAGGQVSIANAAGSTHVVVDVMGWFP